jgi:hypothetical protein
MRCVRQNVEYLNVKAGVVHNIILRDLKGLKDNSQVPVILSLTVRHTAEGIHCEEGVLTSLIYGRNKLTNKQTILQLLTIYVS